MPNGNGKVPREAMSCSIEMPLISLLKAYCEKHDRNISDAVNRAIKNLIALDMSNNPDFWKEHYAKLDE